ncbi:DUF5672 family protein [Mucilaginibacter sp. HD30]
MKDTVAVVIPVYKAQPTHTELVSLKQCLSVLKNHPIIFFGPESMDTTAYSALCDDKVPFVFKRFENSYFENIAGYNRLMLSVYFYNSFKNYRYILIHQLDAYVFKDELVYWCDKGFDFIGAPHPPHQNAAGEMQFLKGYTRFIGAVNRLFGTERRISNVGNGGFSLRNTAKCIWLLKLLHSKTLRWGTNNEDGFFKYWGNLLHPLFRLPPDDIALRFAVEHSVAESLKKLNGQLPFGCHAFEKYEPEFWQVYIEF